MKQIMFSTVFPAYHPYKGKPTRFVEKIWAGLTEDGCVKVPPYYDYPDFNNTIYNSCVPKLHTIRAGNRWKPGDQFEGKIWSDRPYRSKTITFTPVLTVEKVWNFEIIMEKGSPVIFINQTSKVTRGDDIFQIAANDGLEYRDFLDWFNPKGNNAIMFAGQIITWSKKINYV